MHVAYWVFRPVEPGLVAATVADHLPPNRAAWIRAEEEPVTVVATAAETSTTETAGACGRLMCFMIVYILTLHVLVHDCITCTLTCCCQKNRAIHACLLFTWCFRHVHIQFVQEMCVCYCVLTGTRTAGVGTGIETVRDQTRRDSLALTRNRPDNVTGACQLLTGIFSRTEYRLNCLNVVVYNVFTWNYVHVGVHVHS